jgi:hypothetical protein
MRMATFTTATIHGGQWSPSMSIQRPHGSDWNDVELN